MTFAGNEISGKSYISLDEEGRNVMKMKVLLMLLIEVYFIELLWQK